MMHHQKLVLDSWCPWSPYLLTLPWEDHMSQYTQINLEKRHSGCWVVQIHTVWFWPGTCSCYLSLSIKAGKAKKRKNNSETENVFVRTKYYLWSRLWNRIRGWRLAGKLYSLYFFVFACISLYFQINVSVGITVGFLKHRVNVWV